MRSREEQMVIFFLSLDIILTLCICVTLLMSPENTLGSELYLSLMQSSTRHFTHIWLFRCYLDSKYPNPWTLSTGMEDVDSPRASGVNLDSRWVIQSQNASLMSLLNTQKPLPQCWVLREYLWKELMQIIGESKQASLPKK